ncbi:hypothetical protein P872_04115 [Rhodonellum psychrophilum GCM71 = DSM 17998]|uniref:Uncharacterized protein n=1 Tax=Rhodonellum psychrophilum GCM71 = DSM 17998 TaxID=1123057 RepID=U5BYQ7_9BACT|nr:hypothetical protein P872_04115 [Rhodonellum psychrophilum GCM71 = DSM 17998]
MFLKHSKGLKLGTFFISLWLEFNLGDTNIGIVQLSIPFKVIFTFIKQCFPFKMLKNQFPDNHIFYGCSPNGPHENL